uniref:Uncharacterized protein n=1 Tax=Nelumbo nucifera TaxID=4432 RepID=A0A822YMJ7_NELNU|nr:TPA_asm: hypothetical protein HUJ06_011652 [Nelumbo nucifera]
MVQEGRREPLPSLSLSLLIQTPLLNQNHDNSEQKVTYMHVRLYDCTCVQFIYSPMFCSPTQFGELGILTIECGGHKMKLHNLNEL